jgi:NAD+ kinase
LKAVLSPNPYRDRGLKTSKAAQRILEEHGIQTAICLPFELDENSRLDIPANVKLSSLVDELSSADFLVCFGGDGTILHAARDANLRGIPILGINMGSVGFMAELEHSELHHLAKLAAGDYKIEARMMLDVRVYRDEKEIAKDVALNDAVITKGAVARVLDLEITGDGVTMSSFSGDGVIVSTPTGSTAYSLAAGGPIVEPTAENLIVTPISAHSFHARPFVLERNRTVGVSLARGSRKSAYLSVDGGRALKLIAGDRVEIRRSEIQTKLVRLTDRSFYQLIHQKLGKV